MKIMEGTGVVAQINRLARIRPIEVRGNMTLRCRKNLEGTFTEHGPLHRALGLSLGLPRGINNIDTFRIGNNLFFRNIEEVTSRK